ncbi:MAG: glycosyltransferase family 2 protein [Spartobacteria bacterium]|nr:glycosyltransferase family 2 protein [Spartobacteria bacterium]
MKVIIQIPCYNEAESLPVTLGELPRELPGIDRVEWLVIDDGSTDDTIKVAKELGVDHIVRHTENLGLAAAFMSGLEACIDEGADIIVNTDADNQYYAGDIPTLITPILERKADIVIGARPISGIQHFSPVKKLLQRLGSWVVRRVSETNVEDAPSGFRAFSRRAAMKLNVFSKYTYTLETIIQAGQKDLVIASLPIRVNKDLRPSRLMKSMVNYIYNSMAILVRIFMVYRPFRFFTILGTLPMTIGTILGLRFMYYYFIVGKSAGKVQSLILASLLISLGFLLYILALLADLISVNRRLLEKLNWRVQQLEEHHRKPGAHTADDRG